MTNNIVPIPEQYQQLFYDATSDIADIAEELWPVVDELGYSAYTATWDGFVIEIRKKDDKTPPVAS